MSRYINEIAVPTLPAQLEQELADYMAKEGFKLISYKGQSLWRKGYGLAMGPQYIGIYYSPDVIRLEAFVKFALAPGVYFGEMGLSGTLAAVLKQHLKPRVLVIERYIREQCGIK
ncbi:MAG: hypothetical protein LBN30_06450 [Oscillospiraceae bacterium]|jgi:hypothetical protein|nr:hypothetical protein [Oscillospiraceae bacterium]